MSVDTTGGLTFLSPGEQGILANLEFKAGSGDIVYASLQVLGGSDGTWTFADGLLAGMGCKDKNGDFVCMLETTMSSTAIGNYHVGFDVAAGTGVSIPIPEAGSPLLFAAGSLVVGVALRWKAIV
jgi:hypothetical protein